MSQATLLAIGAVLLVAVGSIGAVSAAGAPGGGLPQTDPPAPAPGEHMAGVIGVQDAELEGELGERAFGHRLAGAASDEDRAAVVAREGTHVEDRLSDLEDRLRVLEQRRDRDRISESRYDAEVARIAAERTIAERRAEQSLSVAEGLPSATLQEHGIDVGAIRSLRDRAHELGGPAVAERARTIAGPQVGEPFAEQAREHAPREPGPGGGPGDVSNDNEADGGNPTGDADGDAVSGAGDVLNETDRDATNETEADGGGIDDSVSLPP